MCRFMRIVTESLDADPDLPVLPLPCAGANNAGAKLQISD
jgi:hypothetical protein